MSQANNHNRLIVPVSQNDHTQGAIHAPILLVEYGNYQCPRSGEAHQIIQPILRELGDKICFTFRHFPQPQIYPQSQKAAETSEIAAAQGKFWQMHNKLFSSQAALSNGYLVEYAYELGLDVTQFLRDMNNHVYAHRVAADWESGIHSGVKSTPAFFINSYRYEHTCNVESLTQALLQAENYCHKTQEDLGIEPEL